MSLLTLLDIPKSDVDRPAWLEKQLIGTHLGDLVQQLRYVQQHLAQDASLPAASTDLNSLLGDDREAVLQNGLAVLDTNRLHMLLRDPDLLMSLQELVLIHGGDYWSNLMNPGSASLASEKTVSVTSGMGSATEPQSFGRRTWLWSALATAATVLIVASVAFYRSGSGTASGWGFNNPASFASDGTPAQYLDSLAAAANQWFDKPTADAAALQKRLGEFSRGCTRLIAAKHPPLNDEQRSWLIDKCRDWQTKIDLLQTQVVAGTVSFEEAASQADELVQRMVTTLKAQAQQV